MPIRKKIEKYKGVYQHYTHGKRIEFIGKISIGGIQHQKHCNTEIEAAKAVDMFLIGKGKEPVNILKRKCVS